MTPEARGRFLRTVPVVRKHATEQLLQFAFPPRRRFFGRRRPSSARPARCAAVQWLHRVRGPIRHFLPPRRPSPSARPSVARRAPRPADARTRCRVRLFRASQQGLPRLARYRHPRDSEASRLMPRRDARPASETAAPAARTGPAEGEGASRGPSPAAAARPRADGVRADDKIPAVGRAADFDEAFRAATDRANLPAERGARALRFPLVADADTACVANRPERLKLLSSINDLVARCLQTEPPGRSRRLIIYESRNAATLAIETL